MRGRDHVLRGRVARRGRVAEVRGGIDGLRGNIGLARLRRSRGAIIEPDVDQDSGRVARGGSSAVAEDRAGRNGLAVLRHAIQPATSAYAIEKVLNDGRL